MIIDIDDGAASDPSRTGSKAASLASLARDGFPVPPGFVITADAFDAVLDAAGCRAAIDAALGDPSVAQPAR